MINLYQLLNLSPNADAATIQTIVQHAQAAGNTDPRVIKAAQEWLLKPEVRARYDAKLRQEHPEFFAASVPQSVAHFARPTPKIDAFTTTEPAVAPPTTPSHATPTPIHPQTSLPQRRPKTPVQAAIAQYTIADRTGLWNPQVAFYWSIVFNVAFGATLHALNWQRLGNQKLARANWIWSGIYLVVLLIFIMLFNKKFLAAFFFIHLISTMVWAFTLGKKQIDYVKQELKQSYHKRSWLLPIIVTIGLFLFSKYAFLLIDTLTQYE